MNNMVTNSLNELYRRNIIALHRSLSERNRVVAVGKETNIQCPNCRFDRIHNTSLGTYNGTGPKPFQGSVCPSCNNTGYTSTATRSVVPYAHLCFAYGNQRGNNPLPAGEIKEGQAVLKVEIRYRSMVLGSHYLEVNGTRYQLLVEIPARGLKSNIFAEFKIQLDE